jgi:hypothetical protein
MRIHPPSVGHRKDLNQAMTSRREAMHNVKKRSTGGVLGPAVLVLMGGLAAGAASDAGATNLIVNGGFESGNTGFTSAYALWGGSSDLGGGEYSVTSNAASVHSAFSGSPQAGTQFFVANGSQDTNLAPWQSLAFNVAQVGTYRFEAYISSVVPALNAPPILAFEISSDAGSSWNNLGSTVDLTNAAAGVWYLSYADTTLSTTGSYMIRLRNDQNALQGNDFGLDSIYFGLASAAPSVAVPGTGLAGLATLGLAGVARRRRR